VRVLGQAGNTPGIASPVGRPAADSLDKLQLYQSALRLLYDLGVAELELTTDILAVHSTVRGDCHGADNPSVDGVSDSQISRNRELSAVRTPRVDLEGVAYPLVVPITGVLVRFTALPSAVITPSPGRHPLARDVVRALPSSAAQDADSQHRPAAQKGQTA
jgi:hypothetical protein